MNGVGTATRSSCRSRSHHLTEPVNAPTATSRRRTALLLWMTSCATASAMSSPSAGAEPPPSADVERDSPSRGSHPALDLSWMTPALPYPYALRESWSIPIAHSLGVMTAVRISEAILYPDPFAETDPNVWAMHYEEAFTMPPVFDTTQEPFEWDGDPWPINVVGHALLGSEMYTRMRICRHGPLASIAFTAAGAVVWDYAFEGNGVRPSGLDLVYTPLAGALLGEGRYWMWRGAATLSSPTWRTVLTVIADPLGEFGRALGTDC